MTHESKDEGSTAGATTPLFAEKGLLEVSIGEGYLSAFEAGSLRIGDIVKTARLAGEPYSVYYNGEFLFRGRVMILGERGGESWGVRVYSLSPDPVPPDFPPGRAAPVEYLPFRIVLATARFSLSELGRLGKGSVINLGKGFDPEQDAELSIAGLRIAVGKTVVLYENLGMRITGLIGKAEKGKQESGSYLEPLSTGNRIEREFMIGMSKDYDFKRPDAFTRNAIFRIKDIHDLLCTNLRIIYPGERKTGIQVSQIDQLAFHETFDLLTNGEYGFSIGITRRWTRGVSDGSWRGDPMRSRTTDQTALYLEEEDSSIPLSKELQDRLEKAFEHIVVGDDEIHEKPVFIAYRNSSPASDFFTGDEATESFFRSLRGAWKNVTDQNIGVSKAKAEFGDLQSIHRNEMIVAVGIGVSAQKDEEEDTDDAAKDFNSHPFAGSDLILIYPYLTLDPILAILN